MNLNTQLSSFTEAIIIINSNNLYSSIRDAFNLVHLYNDNFAMTLVNIIVDNQSIIKQIMDKISMYKIRIQFYVSTDLLEILGKTTKEMQNNFILSISSHGYASGNNNYIRWNGRIVSDQMLHDNLVTNMSPQLNCLCLIDTCQSGTMYNLNYQSKDLVTYQPENMSNCSHNIACIGAVDDNEFDQDDISDFGYGGGLTCGFIDFVKGHGSADHSIKNFFLYYKQRVSAVSHHPVMSFNNLSFMSDSN